MKKLILCASCVVLLILMAGCSLKPRTPLTAQEFTDKMEDAGYTVTDATDQYEAGLVDAVRIAVKDNIQIEFYIVPTVGQAEEAYAANVADFDALSAAGASSKTVDISNYSYYRKLTDNSYYIVSRTDNTFIYVEAAAADKDEILKQITDLGY